MRFQKFNIGINKFSELLLKNIIDSSKWTSVPTLTYAHSKFGNITLKLGCDFFLIFSSTELTANDILFKNIKKQINPPNIWQASEVFGSNIILFSNVKDMFSAMNEAESKDLFAEGKENEKDVLNFINFYKTVLCIEHELPFEKDIESLASTIELRAQNKTSPLYEMMDLSKAYARLAEENCQLSYLAPEKKESYTQKAIAALTLAKEQTHLYHFAIAKVYAYLIPDKAHSYHVLSKESEYFFLRLLKQKYLGSPTQQVNAALEILVSVRKWASLQTRAETVFPLYEIFNNQYQELLNAMPKAPIISAEIDRILAIVFCKLTKTQKAFDTYQKIPDELKIGEDWFAMAELVLGRQRDVASDGYIKKNNLQKKHLATEFPLFVRAYLAGPADIQENALSILKNIIIQTYAFCLKQESSEIRPALIDLFRLSDKTIVTEAQLSAFLLVTETTLEKKDRANTIALFEGMLKILAMEKKYSIHHKGYNDKEIRPINILIENIKTCGMKTLTQLLTETAQDIPSIISKFPKVKDCFLKHKALSEQEEIHQDKRQKVG